MATIPASVKYKWTPKDGQDAQAGSAAVTPYRFHPSIIAGANKLEGGTVIDFPIGLGKKLDAVRRFELGTGLGWEEVPAAAQDADTLADLCRKLKATKNPKYVDAFYDIDKMTVAERNKVALLIFDYWGNTEYRFATITSGAFSWDMVNPKDTNDILKSLKAKAVSTHPKEPPGLVRRVKLVPIKLPEVSVVAAKPGTQPQKIVTPDPVLSLLDTDIAEIRRITQRMLDLLKKSAEQMKERLRVASQATALRVMLEQCAGASQSADHVLPMVRRAKEIEKKITDSMRTLKAKEMLKNAQITESLRQVIRKELGFVDDMAAEIERLAEQLCKKLLEDTGVAARAGAFARGVIERKLRQTTSYSTKQNEIILALIDAVMALHEVKLADKYQEMLFEILKRAPDKPALKASDIKDQPLLDVFWSLVGRNEPWGAAATLTTTMVGNVAGPPSLWIALVQLRAWNRMVAALQENLLDAKGADALLNSTIDELNKGIPAQSKVKTQLQEAVAARSQDKLLAFKRDFLDEYSGQRQAAPQYKVGVVLLQILAILVAYQTTSKAKPGEGSLAGFRVLDFFGLAAQGATIVTGVVDTAATTVITLEWKSCVALLERFKGVNLITVSGMAVGFLSSFIGAMASAVQLTDAVNAGDSLGVAVAAAGLSGSLVNGFCVALWMLQVPVPQLQAVGLALASVSAVLAIVKMGVDQSEPGPNKVARALLDAIERSPYYELLKSDGAVAVPFAQLRTNVNYRVAEPETWLPLARNNSFVRDALKRAGLEQQISIIVDNTGAPLTSSGSLID